MIRLAVLLLPVAVSACASLPAGGPSCGSVCRRPRAGASGLCKGADGGQSAQGQPLPAEVPEVPSLEAVDQVLGGKQVIGSPTTLTASQIQCLGASSAVVPALIDEEIDLITEMIGMSDRRKAKVLHLQRELVALREAELRNTAAAATLRLFYRMAEADAQLVLADKVLAEVRRMIQDASDLQKGGTKPPVDQEALKRQEVETRQRRQELLATREQLDRSMRLQLGKDACDPLQIRPRIDWTVAVGCVDRDAAVAAAMSLRRDLEAVRLVLKTLDRDTLPLARGVLKQREGALGSQVAGIDHPWNPRLGAEVPIRHSQLSGLLADQQRSIVAAVLSAADDVEGQYRKCAAASDLRRSWQRQVQDLQALAGSAELTPFRLSEAGIGALRAREEQVRAVVALRLAEVALREAEGALGAECGCRPAQ
jgi:hypothetical protein